MVIKVVRHVPNTTESPLKTLGIPLCQFSELKLDDCQIFQTIVVYSCIGMGGRIGSESVAQIRRDMHFVKLI